MTSQLSFARRAAFCDLAVCIVAFSLCGCSTEPGKAPGRSRTKPEPAQDGGVPLTDGGSTKGPALNIPDASADNGGVTACKNLQCQQVECASGTTSVTGTVYAPNGKLPLYNVRVYVPNAALPKVAAGVTCDRCGGVPPGEPVVSALTDHTGAFRLENVPVGGDIPLVFQVGKWRRQITIPEVKACSETNLSDPEQTRLPRNRGEGDMPRIAVTTGSCDNIACLIPKLGIDPEEWGVRGEDKAVTFFSSSDEYGVPDGDFPDSPSWDPEFGPGREIKDASELWGDEAELSKHDMAVLSCECHENLMNKPARAFSAMTDYLAKGGRVFGTDFQYVWYKKTSDQKLKAAMNIPGGAPGGMGPVKLHTDFPKGKALADWLKFVAPATQHGILEPEAIFANFLQVDTDQVQVWGTSQGPLPNIITVNTPVGVPSEQQCGKGVHLDLHITSPGFGFEPNLSFEERCGPELNDGEKVLAFFFFDLASCIQEEGEDPEPPRIEPPR